MKHQWTEKHLQTLLRKGKIRAYTVQSKAKSTASSIPVTEKRSQEKNWLSWNLKIWADENNLLMLTEHQFHKQRLWRFDWSFPDLLVAVEYEGIMSDGKAHSSITGILRDIDKYNAAQALGWRVIRITAKDYKTVLQQLNFFLKDGNHI